MKSLTSTTISPKIYSPSQPSLWRAITGVEAPRTVEREPLKVDSTDLSESGLTRARKYRIHPDKEQRAILDQWFGVTRFVYNKAVALSHNKELSSKDLNKQALRDAFFKGDVPEWITDVPYDVRDDALDDFVKARKAQFAKLKIAKQAGLTLNPWKFKFRKKQGHQTMLIRGRNWGCSKGVFATLFGPDKMKKSPSDEAFPVQASTKCRKKKKNPEDPDPPSAEEGTEVVKDFRVIKDLLGHYYVCMPRQVHVRSESQAPDAFHATIALDPGVRTFQTCYNADGTIVEWGKEDMTKIFQLCHTADRLQGRINEARQKKRRRRRKAWLRLLERIRNKVDEVHKKLATWLCENHRVVLIPVFETQQMVNRRDRKIGSRTARALCTWSHYRFRQRLKQKAELYPWCKIVECNEAYTSKTCGRCGHLHTNLGSNKTFICPHCSYAADRDCSAARNILLRYLTQEVGQGIVS